MSRKPFCYRNIGCWGDNAAKIAEYHHHNGIGVFSEQIAFRFDGEAIVPVKNIDAIRLSDLKHYEAQRNKIVENTLSFLHSKPCNNILLYGDRGTGKSSTVKALLNEYYGMGLRIVQVEKEKSQQFIQVDWDAGRQSPQIYYFYWWFDF